MKGIFVMNKLIDERIKDGYNIASSHFCQFFSPRQVDNWKTIERNELFKFYYIIECLPTLYK